MDDKDFKDLPINIGVKFKNLGPINKERHKHETMHEYFLVLEGQIILSVNDKEITLREGDLLVVEPGECHGMLSKSPDSRYILLMPKQVLGDKVSC